MAKTGGRPRSLDMRLVVNALLYIVVGGRCCRKNTRNGRVSIIRRWCDDGTWQRIHDTLRAKVRCKAGKHKQPTAGCLDSQSVKTTAIAGIRGFDGAKLIKGRKRHVLVDTLGLLLVIVVTAVSVPERAGAKLVLQRLTGACKKLRLVWLDGGYRGPSLLDWVTEHCRFCLKIVLRSDDKKGFIVLPRRWVVERTFAWLNHQRRLSKDYERLPVLSEAFIYIAMIRLMLRRLAPA